MNDNIDNFLDQFDQLEEVKPSDDFLEKLENKALSFTELRVRYGKKMIIGIFILVAGVLIINAIHFKYQNSDTTEEKSQSNEYDLIPANTVNYE